jgi:hypothetical protein
MATVLHDFNVEMNEYVALEYQHKLERELGTNILGGNIKSWEVVADIFRDVEHMLDITRIMVVLVTCEGKKVIIPAEIKNFPQPELIAKLELLA